jgi:uracil-DNA glycosylase family 4
MMIQEPQGPSNGIVFVGEAPGRKEIDLGKPFVGESGWILKNLCKAVGIDLSRSYISNICDEMPPMGEFERFPKAKVVAGTQKLRERLLKWNPRIIVALGKHPLRATTGYNVISDYRGSVIPSTLIPGTKVVATFHPAYLLPRRQNSHYTPIARLDLEKAKRESAFREIRYPKRNIYTINNPIEAIEFLSSIRPRPVTVDIETAGHILTAFGVALAKDECYSITHNCFKDREVLRAIGRFCNSDIPKIYHNALYDVLWLAHYMGVMTRNIYFDTMLAQHVCYSIYLKSLQFCASVYTDEPHWKDRKDYLPSQGLYEYNARDCGVTYEVYEKLLKEIEETKSQTAFKHIMEMIDPTLVAMLHGVRTDKEAFKAIKEANEDIIRKYKYLTDKIIPGVNVNSPQQLKELFYDEWGFKPVKLKGKITTNAMAVNKMERLPTPYQSVFGLIRALKGAVKGRSFYNYDVDPDGRIRTAYKLTGTKTFRLSSSGSITGSGTNLQNIPKLMRRIYLPDPGDIWLQWDLSQAEARIVAALCKDFAWLKAFDEDDIHWQVAEFIFKKHRSQLKKTYHRQIAKKVSHATHYLESWKSLSELICCTAAEAKQFIAHYHLLRPNLADWHAEVHEAIMTKRELRTPYDNRMIFPGSMSPEAMPLPMAVAFVPQSTCVQYANTAWKKQAKELDHVKGLLQVHDSVASSVEDNPKVIIETMKAMKELTEVPVRIGDIELVIPIDFEIGDNWYKLHECSIETFEETYDKLQRERREKN